MNILITGAGGFIGSHLAGELIKRKYKVRGIFMPGEETARLEGLGIDVFRGDLTRPDTLAGVTKDMDTIYHLATRTLDWGTRKQFERIMVDGTKNLLEESTGKVSRFVYFSSVAALGLGRDLNGLDEDAKRIRCGIPYCDTKIIAEDIVKNICTKKGIDYTIIRPSNVFGPGSVWVRDVLDAFLRGPVPLINKGKHPAALVYIQNLGDGTILAAKSKTAVGKTYHFRDDYPITWGTYLKTLGRWVGKKPSVNLSFPLAWTLGAFFEKLLTHLVSAPPSPVLPPG
jgi:nucleoside-diphosphate-sugar epimerase